MKKISVNTHTPRMALTHWRAKETVRGVCLLELDIRMSQIHQIGVYCLSMGYPVIGDAVYGNRGDEKRLSAASAEMSQAVTELDYQMLHAWRIRTTHPVGSERMTVEVPIGL